MTFQVLFAIVLLSATTSVISGAPVRSDGDQAVEKGVISGAPVRSDGDQAVEKGVISGGPVRSGGFDNLQDSYWEVLALQYQLAQLAHQIQDADGDDPSEMGHLIAQYHQLQAQAQPIIDQVYG